MKIWKSLVFGAFLFLAAGLAASEAARASRGFNDNINWLTNLDSAKEAARVSDKPIFLLIHKTWCGACKRLKTQFTDSEALEEWSQNFVMVNLEDAEEPEDPQFKPDGGYIPRIFFLDSKGNLDTELFNVGGNPKYKYFYTSAQQIVSGMQRAVKKLTSKNAGKVKDDL